MAGISQAIATSFKLECLLAVHNFSSDIFNIALYDATIGNLDATTAIYTTFGEISGSGYAAGGMTLALTSGWPQIVGTTGACRFNDATWNSATFSADGALIYNASKGNRAVMSLLFPARQSPFNGVFTVRFPTTLNPIVQIN
jgi:hypothetical protein